MEKKIKKKVIPVEKTRDESPKSNKMQFTDKERKRRETKYHTIGGF